MAKSPNEPNETPSADAKGPKAPQIERKRDEPQKKPAPRPGTWRETVESVAIAFILAFLFRSFEAEAFVIPTGSMATTLMGRHKDLKCPKCGYWYQVSASDEVDRDYGNRRIMLDPHGPLAFPDPNVTVVAGVCPMCRFRQETTRRAEVGPSARESRTEDPAGTSYKGDRIIVVKSYNVLSPKRWDVFVFRFPEKAATNYIKRLVGLPEEVLRIDENGDVYVRPLNSEESAFRILRKPPDKMLAMARDVYDNDYVLDEMTKLGWPPRWQPAPADLPQLVAAGWPNTPTVWPWTPTTADITTGAGWTSKDNYRSFETAGQSAGAQWLRYQHIVPREEHWEAMASEISIGDAMRDPRRLVPPPEPRPIEDYLSYNDAASATARFDGQVWRFSPLGNNYSGGLPWVGDLLLECTLTGQGKGAAILELCESSHRFHCHLDFTTGDATLSIDDGQTPFETKDRQAAQSKLVAKGVVPKSGAFDVRFANVDSQLVLWINGSVVTFENPAIYSFDTGVQHAYDFSPVAVASLGAPLTVEHLRIRRDLFYGSRPNRYRQVSGAVQSVEYHQDGSSPGPLIVTAVNHGLNSNQHVEIRGVQGMEEANGTFLVEYVDPNRFALIDTRGEGKYTGGGTYRSVQDFVLLKDQFFALGDNSARSADSREWSEGRKYVHRDLLIGQAFFIFWPHSWDEPVPFTPNFPRMQFVR